MDAPVTRIQQYLNRIATGEGTIPPYPITRIEYYLQYIIEHGGGGGASFEVVIVDELPETGENGKIYLVPNEGEEPDIYDEYLWIQSESKFERIGSTRIEFTNMELKFTLADGTTETHNFLIND